MAQNYTAWPTYTQIITHLTNAGIPIRSGVENSYYTQEVDAVVADLQRVTHRQFIPGSAGEERSYDGSGTGEQPVDDMIAMTAVEISGWIGIQSFNVTSAVLLNQNSFPRNRIIIAQGPPFQFVNGIFTKFPEGRANVTVTGTYGFGQYIPDDVWIAVRNMTAARIAGAFLSDSTTGRIMKSFIEGSSSEKYVDGEPGSMIGEAQGWVQSYRKVIQVYRKPINARLKTMKKVMI